ncbi:hypothetical protein PC128_g27454, partial [Phytophthora cactorum]
AVGVATAASSTLVRRGRDKRRDTLCLGVSSFIAAGSRASNVNKSETSRNVTANHHEQWGHHRCGPRALEASGDGATAPYQSHRTCVGAISSKRTQTRETSATRRQEDKRHEDHQELRRVREFSSIAACLEALRENEMTIWATDLSPQAEPLVASNKPNELPARLAIVIGRETNGVSPEMLRAAHRRVYLPLFGFSESLNLSVATALVLQRLLDW